MICDHLFTLLRRGVIPVESAVVWWPCGVTTSPLATPVASDQGVVMVPLLTPRPAPGSEDDSMVDYTSMLGIEERRQRFSEEVQDRDLKDSVRLQKMYRELQRQVYCGARDKVSIFGMSGRGCNQSPLDSQLAMTIINRYFHDYFLFPRAAVLQSVAVRWLTGNDVHYIRHYSLSSLSRFYIFPRFSRPCRPFWGLLVIILKSRHWASAPVAAELLILVYFHSPS